MRAPGTAAWMRAATWACSRSIAAAACGRSASGLPSSSATSSTSPPRGEAGRPADAPASGSTRPAAARTNRPLRKPKAYVERRKPAATLCLASGCGGIGRRARFRSVWGRPRGGSSPLIRISFRSRAERGISSEARLRTGPAEEHGEPRRGTGWNEETAVPAAARGHRTAGRWLRAPRRLGLDGRSRDPRPQPGPTAGPASPPRAPPPAPTAGSRAASTAGLRPASASSSAGAGRAEAQAEAEAEDHAAHGQADAEEARSGAGAEAEVGGDRRQRALGGARRGHGRRLGLAGGAAGDRRRGAGAAGARGRIRAALGGAGADRDAARRQPADDRPGWAHDGPRVRVRRVAEGDVGRMRHRVLAAGLLSALLLPAAAGGKTPAPPETMITSGPAALTNVATAAFAFSSNDARARFACALDAGAFFDCTSPYTTTVGDGAHHFYVVAIAGGQTDPTPAVWAWTVDTTPPAPARPRATIRYGHLTISWGKLTTLGANIIALYRSTSEKQPASQEVYRGDAATYVDKHFRNGAFHRYRAITVDAAGNASAPADFEVGPDALLISPKDDARLRAPLHLRWRGALHATYYNAQLFRAGRKILSAWPRTPRMTVQKHWKFDGRPYTLKPGRYTWFVWPGFGALALGHYGQLLGHSTFSVR